MFLLSLTAFPSLGNVCFEFWALFNALKMVLLLMLKPVLAQGSADIFHLAFLLT